MLKKNYDKSIEEKWQKYWEKEKIYGFNPESRNKIYSIDTPPPTVSGKMHMGHAFSYAQQDMVVRYKRMQGCNIFYPFGTDDNGLATERLIEKEKNVKATQMPRDEFVKVCLDTLLDIRKKYISDWKALGMSCDWSIFYTTINDHCRKISQKSFIDLYKKGLEYRKRTPFMWCPECQTAIAQVELKDKETESKFVYMKFDTSIGEPIIIATTRPELMCACVAVHVHPDDRRYKKFIGAKAKIPFYNREVKIYANKNVDMNFGSGAVYHCTFGDMEDAEWIEKLKIKPIEVINKNGTYNEKAGKYSGMNSKEARKRIIQDLKEAKRLVRTEPIKHVVNVHERCGTEIEILMTDQWFIKYLDKKKLFLEAGKKLNWHPKFMMNRYTNWVKGLKWDWCISRQRFFGVPFPVWYCKKCKEIILAEEKQLPVDPLKDKPLNLCPKCRSEEFIPEKDVLDTWATSSLTPQITASLFPKQYKKLYPMNLRPQAHDIITFWLFNTLVKSQLHNHVNPWKDIMISGFVLDPKKEKMSKSKGNVIEPQEIMNKYSADALRFWAASSKLGEDLPFKEKEIIFGQKTITKLWNASKFSLQHLDNYKLNKPKKLEIIDVWLLSKLQKVIKSSSEAFEKYDYSRTKIELENFFWNIFCDQYLEIVKKRLYNPKNQQEKISAQYTLYYSLLNTLKLFAPIMPHVTEEIYHVYFIRKEKKKSIHLTSWPIYNKRLENKKIEDIGDLFVEILSKARQFKSKHNKSLKTEIVLILNKKDKIKLKDCLEDLKAVTNAKEIKWENRLDISF